MKNKPRYKYENVVVLDVYDADSITLLIHLGFDVSKKIKVRFLGINAWEVRGKEKKKGIEARDYLRNRLNMALLENKKIWIETFKDAKGKYGRYLGNIYIDKTLINKELIDKGYAVEYLI